MKGGLLGFGAIGKAMDFASKGIPITLETFRKEGYAYAENALYNTTNAPLDYKLIKGDSSNTNKISRIKTDYKSYYDTLTDANKKITQWVPDARIPNGARPPVNMFAADSKTLLVDPTVFNEIIGYIASGDIQNKKLPILTKQRNQKYVDFGRSFIAFIDSKSPSNLSKLSGATGGLTEKATGMLGSVSGKVPGFGSLFGPK
jgi:hypothetical protein